MKNSLYKIKKVQSNKNDFKLNINKFEIHRGVIYMFLGRIGVGKTTLLNVLSKKQSYNGQIDYDGEDLSKCTNYNKEIAFISNPPNSFLTVEKYINKYINKYDAIKKKSKDYKSVVRMTGISPILNKRLFSLSMNQRRVVSLVAGILADPKVLIIDDLDMYLTSEELKVFKKILLRKANYDGVTIIASCRYIYNFPKFASVNITLDSGRIVRIRS